MQTLEEFDARESDPGKIFSRDALVEPERAQNRNYQKGNSSQNL